MNKKKKKIGLTTKIFIALLLGALAGIVIHYLMPAGTLRDEILVNGIFYVIGQGFIRLMQMLVVPLVFFSIICGASAIGDTKTLGSVGLKTIGFYLITTALAITVAIVSALIVRPGVGVDLSNVIKSEIAATESTSLSETLLNIIPTNPIRALAEGSMLQIILFALIVGVILAKLGDRVETISNLCSQGNAVMMEMTVMVMELAPVGVFCLIAKTFSTSGFESFIPMIKYVLNVLGALAIQGFGVYLLLLFLFTRLNPFKFIKKWLPVMSFAFSTATSNATIPLSIETLFNKVGVSKKISSFTIPLGATINMDGTAIMQGVAAIFTAQIFGIDLGISDYLTVIATATLASIGTAGVPSVGLITLTMVFNSIGLPIEGIALIMGIDRILDMARTAINVTGDAVCTIIVSDQNKALDRQVYNTP